MLPYINKAVYQIPFTTAAGILVTPFTTRAPMSQIFVLKTLSGELRGTLFLFYIYILLQF